MNLIYPRIQKLFGGGRLQGGVGICLDSRAAAELIERTRWFPKEALLAQAPVDPKHLHFLCSPLGMIPLLEEEPHVR